MDSFAGRFLRPGWSRRIDLAKHLVIGIVLQYNGIGWTPGIAEPIALAENRIHPGLFAIGGLTELYGTIGTSFYTCPTGHTLVFIHLAYSAGGCDPIL